MREGCVAVPAGACQFRTAGKGGKGIRTKRMVLGSRFHGGAVGVAFCFVLLWYIRVRGGLGFVCIVIARLDELINSSSDAEGKLTRPPFHSPEKKPPLYTLPFLTLPASQSTRKSNS